MPSLALPLPLIDLQMYGAIGQTMANNPYILLALHALLINKPVEIVFLRIVTLHTQLIFPPGILDVLNNPLKPILPQPAQQDSHILYR